MIYYTLIISDRIDYWRLRIDDGCGSSATGWGRPQVRLGPPYPESGTARALRRHDFRGFRMPRLRGACRSAGRPPIPAPLAGRLIRHPRVIRAIGQAADGVAAAKEKLAAAGIADRPPAGLLGPLQDGPALADRKDVIDQFRCGLRLHFVGVGECGIAADRSTADAHHG